jgi:hypothetical protein
MKRLIVAILISLAPITATATSYAEVQDCRHSETIWVRVGLADVPWTNYFQHFSQYQGIVAGSPKLTPFYANFEPSCYANYKCTHTPSFKSFLRKVKIAINKLSESCYSQYPNRDSTQEAEGLGRCLQHRMSTKNIDAAVPTDTACHEYEVTEHKYGLVIRHESGIISRQIIARMNGQRG